MFEKLNIQKCFNETKNIVDKKKTIFPYDMLGRSLAANAFYPKDAYDLLSKNNDVKFFKNFDLADINFDIAILNTSNYLGADIQNLSYFRRYCEKLLIQFDFIFDEYQILESIVYGADAFYFVVKALSLKDLRRLYNFALHLGLEAVFYIENKRDLNNAILAGARILHIDDEKLLSSIPKNKIILSYKNIGNALIKDV